MNSEFQSLPIPAWAQQMGSAIRARRWKGRSAVNAGLAPQLFKVGAETISAIVENGHRLPVVFIHGNSAAKTVWLHQIVAVRERGHAVLALDLPGHGQSLNSPRPKSTYNFPGYATVVSDLLRQLGWQSAHLVGWSLGGHIGLELLASEERLASLLIVGAPPIELKAGSVMEAFHETPSMALTGKSQFTDAGAVAYGTDIMGGERLLTLEILNAVRRADGRARETVVTDAMNGIGADQRKAVETIAKPLCVVHGEADAFISLNYLRKLRYRALWRNAIQVICNAGHAPHWQCPETFNRILLEFLADAERQNTKKRNWNSPQRKAQHRR